MILSDSLLEIPFFGRSNDINKCIHFLISHANNCPRKQLLLLGESGTGKSRFVKELIYKIKDYEQVNNYTFLYIDAFDSINDELSENFFFEILLFYALSEKKYRKNDVTKIINKNTFKSYIRSSNIKATLKNTIYSTLRNSLTLIPNIGSEIKNILPAKLQETDKKISSSKFEINVLFQNYITNLTKKEGLIFILDNYQFISKKDRSLLKHILKALNENIIFIQVIRTEEKDNLIDIIKENTYYEDFISVILESLNQDELKKLLAINLKNIDSHELNLYTDYCFKITNGNYKEIEQFIINQNNSDQILFQKYIDSPIVMSINRMSKIKKDILLLTSLFPTGIKIDYIKDIIELDESKDENKQFILAKHLNFLIENKFIKSSSNELIKPAHEKIIHSLDKMVDDENFITIRTKVIDVFKLHAEKADNSSDFIFLINSLIGLQKLYELKNDIKLLVKYINLLSDDSQFSKLVFLYEKITTENNSYVTTVINHLPIYTITIFLNAFQKNSRFYLGLQLLESLKTSYSSDLFEARYLTQLYKYEEAISILEHKLDNMEYYCVYLNLLLQIPDKLTTPHRFKLTTFTGRK